ncbi:MAG: four helix bundle protein [Ignavibacteriales bacterium]|nr:MAG: four helix bundle protein [Ignavibacteriales bacterium]
MNPKTEELLDRTFQFGIKCLRLLQELPQNQIFAVLTYQLAKASTSVGANYEEAQGAESKKDFVHKIGIVLKEIRESNYWLRVLNEILIKPSLNEEAESLIKESSELKSIFSSIKIKAGKGE